MHKYKILNHNLNFSWFNGKMYDCKHNSMHIYGTSYDRYIKMPQWKYYMIVQDAKIVYAVIKNKPYEARQYSQWKETCYL